MATRPQVGMPISSASSLVTSSIFDTVDSFVGVGILGVELIVLLNGVASIVGLGAEIL